jgi:hypothetical protein
MMERFGSTLCCRRYEVRNVLSDSTVTWFIRPDRIVASTLKMEAACFCYNLPLHCFFLEDRRIKYSELNDSKNYFESVLIFVCHRGNCYSY